MFLRSGRPRGPGKPFQNVGGFAPHIFEGLPGPPGAGQTSKTHPNKSGQTAFKYPVISQTLVALDTWGAPTPEPGVLGAAAPQNKAEGSGVRQPPYLMLGT